MAELGGLLHQHIFLALLLGGLFEGETVVVLAGFVAHQGHVPWWQVMLFAALINAAVDQAWFALGRWRGAWLLQRLPRLQPRVDALQPRIHAHRRLLIMGTRFTYGMRTAGPLALGIAGVSPREFLLFNLPAALLWASLFSGLGYLFGMTMLALLEDVRREEGWLALAVLGVGGVAWLIHRVRRHGRG